MLPLNESDHPSSHRSESPVALVTSCFVDFSRRGSKSTAVAVFVLEAAPLSVVVGISEAGAVIDAMFDAKSRASAMSFANKAASSPAAESFAGATAFVGDKMSASSENP